MSFHLRDRSLTSLDVLTPKEIRFLLDLSADLKMAKYSGSERQRLTGKNIALIFEKSSTRTRCAFEVAAYDQGANVTYLGPSGSQIGYKESMKDTARVLGRMYDAIEYRGFSQHNVDVLKANSNVPVWNGLTDEYHPTQILADLLTMREHSDKPLRDVRFCFLGDGDNNMGRSLMIGAAQMGMDFRMASPVNCQPDKNFIRQCNKIAKATDARLLVTDDAERAVKGCDYLYTDVWVSMGEPDDVWEKRIKALLPYQVNAKLMKATGNRQCKFMHCLPAFHNRETVKGEEIFARFGLDALEVTDEVFESEASIVFDQAENRLHTIKAVMVASLCF
ncbi:Ornithine carbamoyltransferase [BD1-7 clade bacterium]|uniref:Ornithine carbamoyltransferase n=1 Tax=BD1-7 clade bacterium TaxID=2029982 RepID=A0A5S9P1Y6_9GAMM|nr:Ornithine carbamoyltransferase [BD1-7 clade bacterium]CAA0097178.1 Ornithine carbamoyltransferase [BD1-7 clade bacterium]CAA0109792.1 Ornithine carbamoyltransferase [BD1-7 clade bacterium]CAA0116436.1 Ornithine carbamoyltransferase [BD1-7 clade bacterium]CAA0120085.1 Ornithine carbamoyltransferase [BD1-7 clade bacterium]